MGWLGDKATIGIHAVVWLVHLFTAPLRVFSFPLWATTDGLSNPCHLLGLELLEERPRGKDGGTEFFLSSFLFVERTR